MRSEGGSTIPPPKIKPLGLIEPRPKNEDIVEAQKRSGSSQQSLYAIDNAQMVKLAFPDIEFEKVKQLAEAISTSLILSTLFLSIYYQ